MFCRFLLYYTEAGSTNTSELLYIGLMKVSTNTCIIRCFSDTINVR